jgi:Arc/MetJ family transcription regulator
VYEGIFLYPNPTDKQENLASGESRLGLFCLAGVAVKVLTNTHKLVYYTHKELGQREGQMRTNIVIDDSLIQRAMRATGLRTKRAVVEAGLQLLIQIKAQTGIRRLRGKIKWEGNLDEMRASRI